MANKTYSDEFKTAVITMAKEDSPKAAAEKHKVSYQTVLRWIQKPERKRPGQSGSEATVTGRGASTKLQEANGAEKAMKVYQDAKASFEKARAALVAAL